VINIGATVVESSSIIEAPVGSIDSYRNRLFRKSSLNISAGNSGSSVSLDSVGHLRFIKLASLVSGGVRVILIAHDTIVEYVFEGCRSLTAITSLVAIVSGTVNQLLFRKSSITFAF